MESKVLYTNEATDIQCVAVKSIETVRVTSGTSRHHQQQRTPLTSSTAHDTVLFLLPRERLYSYLYIGAADGTLLALRFHIALQEMALPGGGSTFEHRVALEAQSKVVLAPSAAAATTASSPSSAPETAAASVLRGVRHIDAPTVLPYVFLRVYGRFQAHEADTLQLLDADYTAPLNLPASVVLWMCRGEEQTVASRQRRPSAPPDSPSVCYAILLDTWEVVLAECTKTYATRLPFLGGSAETFDWSGDKVGEGLHTAGPSTLLSVLPGTSTLAWCGDVLLTGSPDYYCLYDTLHGTLLSQLEVGSLLGGCAPYTTFIRHAAVDPSKAGFALADESAAVCSCCDESSDEDSHCQSSSSSSGSSGSRSSSSRGTSLTSSEGSSGRSSSEDGAGHHKSHHHHDNSAAGWPSALVFKLSDGELHVCVGAGATDLTRAAPLATMFGAVHAVYSCPPFLLCQRGGGDDNNGEEAAEERKGEKAPSLTTRFRSSLAGLRRASQHLSAKLNLARLPTQLCEMVIFSCLDRQPWTSPTVDPVSFMSVNVHDMCVFPLGLLGVSRHMVEALMWRPFGMQLDGQVQSGHYARVLRFVSQCFRGSEAARCGVLRRACQACARAAMACHRYRVAFYFYAVAEAGVESLLRLFPELRRPRQTETALKDVRSDAQLSHESSMSLGGMAEGGARATRQESALRQLSYTSGAPYRALYRILVSQFFSLVASEAAAAAFDASSPSSSSSAAPGSVRRSFPPAPSTEELMGGTTNAAMGSPASADGAAATATGVRSTHSQPHSTMAPRTSFSAATAADSCASVEFALFCLFAIDCAGVRRVCSTRDELLQFMASVQTLNRDDCGAVVTALGLPPQALLTTMVLAASGDFDAALTLCRENGDVTAARATLAMYARTRNATAEALSRLYHLHLPWMLEADPPAMVTLLTTPAAFPGEKPSPAVMVPLLLTVGGTVLLDYLSHLINAQGSTDPIVHQLYATQLVRTLRTLRDEWGLQGFASAELGAADGAGAETGLVGHVRSALLSFLQWSPFYNKEGVLAVLLAADLHEERCVVLESLEDHIGVLTVLVYTMKDIHRAVRYCEARYAQDRAQAQRSLPLTELLQLSEAASAAGGDFGGGGAGQCAGETEVVGLRQCGGTSWTTTTGRGAKHGAAASAAAAVTSESERGVTGAPLFPSRDCSRLLAQEAAAMAHYTHTVPTAADAATAPTTEAGVVSIAVAPSRVPARHPLMRFNFYLHMLLHVLLVPPQGSEMALAELVWLLSTHSPFMSPRLVLASLHGDLPFFHIAPYLIRVFQRLELNHQLVQMESAAMQSTLADAVRRHVTLQQRCVWMTEERRCVACGGLMERGGLIVVFPNLKPAHFRCHQEGTLDPERGVPFLSTIV